MTEQYLIHYGVKGMKWGIIKDRIPSPLKSRYNRRLERSPNSYKGQTINRKDAALLGKSSARRISRYEERGYTRKQAVTREIAQKTVAIALVSKLASSAIRLAGSETGQIARINIGNAMRQKMTRGKNVADGLTKSTKTISEIRKAFQGGWDL